MGNDSSIRMAHWTEDSAQCEEFFSKVGSKIVSESNFISRRYKVEKHKEDIVSYVKVKLLQKTLDKNSPFAEASPKDAADFYLDKENFWIREQARLLARKIGRAESKIDSQKSQDEVLANVRQPDLSPERETQLRAIAAGIPRVISEIPDFTPRDKDIFRKEVLRQIGIDDLSSPTFDEVVQSAGITSSVQREHNKYHDKYGRNSASDRKAWARAKAKVAKAFTIATLKSLLAIIFTLCLALLTCFQEDHQKDFVFENRPVYLLALSKGHQ